MALLRVCVEIPETDAVALERVCVEMPETGAVALERVCVETPETGAVALERVCVYCISLIHYKSSSVGETVARGANAPPPPLSETLHMLHLGRSVREDKCLSQ